MRQTLNVVVGHFTFRLQTPGSSLAGMHRVRSTKFTKVGHEGAREGEPVVFTEYQVIGRH